MDVAKFFEKHDAGVYFVKPSFNARVVEDEAKNRNFRYYYMDGRIVQNAQDFFTQARTVIQLPDYFGDNWNAFWDCMTAGWNPNCVNPYVLFYDEFELIAKTPEEFHWMLEVFYQCVMDRGPGTYFFLRGNLAVLPFSMDFSGEEYAQYVVT